MLNDLPLLDWDAMQQPGPYEEHGVTTISIHQLMLDNIVNEDWWSEWSAYSDEVRYRLDRKSVV